MTPPGNVATADDLGRGRALSSAYPDKSAGASQRGVLGRDCGWGGRVGRFVADPQAITFRPTARVATSPIAPTRWR